MHASRYEHSVSNAHGARQCVNTCFEHVIELTFAIDDGLAVAVTDAAAMDDAQALVPGRETAVWKHGSDGPPQNENTVIVPSDYAESNASRSPWAIAAVAGVPPASKQITQSEPTRNASISKPTVLAPNH